MQGLNSGLQDVINLGWKLALVTKGLAPASLLSTYNEERLPVITEMLQLTTGLWTQARKQENFNRGSLMCMLEINYRWSRIAVDERLVGEEKEASVARAYVGNVDGVHAGDRAPDAPGLKVISAGLRQGEVSLFGLFKMTKQIALIFVKPTTDAAGVASVCRVLEALPSGTVEVVAIVSKDFAETVGSMGAFDLVLQDKGGHAFRGYKYEDEGSGPVVAIIRPDTYIGAFTNNVGGVRRYLETVFGHVPSA
jgi:hypothetical protein